MLLFMLIHVRTSSRTLCCCFQCAIRVRKWHHTYEIMRMSTENGHLIKTMTGDLQDSDVSPGC